jgi:hypothetical protein
VRTGAHRRAVIAISTCFAWSRVHGCFASDLSDWRMVFSLLLSDQIYKTPSKNISIESKNDAGDPDKARFRVSRTLGTENDLFGINRYTVTAPACSVFPTSCCTTWSKPYHIIYHWKAKSVLGIVTESVLVYRVSSQNFTFEPHWSGCARDNSVNKISLKNFTWKCCDQQP